MNESISNIEKDKTLKPTPTAIAISLAVLLGIGILGKDKIHNILSTELENPLNLSADTARYTVQTKSIIQGFFGSDKNFLMIGESHNKMMHEKVLYETIKAIPQNKANDTILFVEIDENQQNLINEGNFAEVITDIHFTQVYLDALLNAHKKGIKIIAISTNKFNSMSVDERNVKRREFMHSRMEESLQRNPHKHFIAFLGYNHLSYRDRQDTPNHIANAQGANTVNILLDNTKKHPLHSKTIYNDNPSYLLETQVTAANGYDHTKESYDYILRMFDGFDNDESQTRVE